MPVTPKHGRAGAARGPAWRWIVAAAVMAGAASGQPEPAKPEKPAATERPVLTGLGRIPRVILDDISSANKLASEGKYLASLVAFERLAKAHAGEHWESLVLQSLAVARSTVGDYAGALRAFDDGLRVSGESVPPLPASAQQDRAEPVPAMPEILDAIRNHRIVIINEAHHCARDRVLPTLLLPELKKLGFRYFAAETLADGEPLQRLIASRRPARDTGAYSAEPLFGDLIREALRLGFTPVAYEVRNFQNDPDPTESFFKRDAAQAQSLYDQVLRNDPDAKILIYCGYDHINESVSTGPDGRVRLCMAGALARLTGQNPLTIDQVTGNESGDPDYASLPRRYALSHDRIHGLTLFRYPDGSYYAAGRYTNGVDLQVYFPATTTSGGRPEWMTMDGRRRAVDIPADLKLPTGRALVQAFVAPEPDDSIPMDQLVVDPAAAADSRPHLVLPPGDYRVVVQDEQGAERARSTLRVE